MHKYLALAFTALLTAAGAQSTPNLLKQELVRSQVVMTTDKDGKKVETLKLGVKSALPGDIFEDTDTMTNTGQQTISNVSVDLRVRPGVYVSSSASRNDVRTLFSFDNGKTYAAAPLKKTVKFQENGRTVTREVEVKPSEYTNVRFAVPSLKPSETVKVTLRFRVG